MSNLRRWRLTF